MTINDGYYIAECTSSKVPVSKKDAETFYLPIDIVNNPETGLYEFKEYRFNLPVNYGFPTELLEYMANELDEYRKALQEVGVI